MLDWNHGGQLKKRKNINKLQMQALKTKLLSFLSSFGKVLKEAWWGPPTTPPPAVRDLPKAFGFPPLIWYLQTECTRMRLLFSFHFRESAERASYSTNPWRNAQYLCGNVCRHCASREKKILMHVSPALQWSTRNECVQKWWVTQHGCVSDLASLSWCVTPLKGSLKDGSGAVDKWDCHCVEPLTLEARWEGGYRLREEMFLGNPDFIKSMRMKYPRQDDQLFTSEVWCPSALIESRLPGPPNASMNEHILPWAADTFQTWYKVPLGFQVGASGKEPACQCRRCKRGRFDPCVRKIPWRRAWQPTAVFLPGEPHGQRSLTDYSKWGHKESDLTEGI